MAPDRLRFDFSHYEPVTPEQIEEIERLTNANTLANTDVRVRDDEDRRRGRGAIAFFGDKYGGVVEVEPARRSSCAVGRTSAPPGTSARSRS